MARTDRESGRRRKGGLERAGRWPLVVALVGLVAGAPTLVFEGGWAGEEGSEEQPLALQAVVPGEMVGKAFMRSPLEEPRGVALTFDDGPAPGMTDRILDILKEERAPATFFVVGKMAHAYPGLVRRIAAEGHVLGNHTWGHSGEALSYETYLNELDSTCGAVCGQSNANTVFFRPPYRRLPEALKEAARARGYAVVLWSVDPQDYGRISAETIRRRVLSAAKAGGIVLLHDGGRMRTNTIEALPGIIRGLREKGLPVVGLAELLGATTVPVQMPGEQTGSE